MQLAEDLQTQTYRHGNYESFVVHDPKRREIAVAGVRDRVVHRLLYDYLVPIWDKSFCYDAWSCRKDKGLLGAIERAQTNTYKYRNGWLWRSDITKFFDNVDHRLLRRLLRTKLHSPQVLWLLDKTIASYDVQASKEGMPIGNLTSQIFANIYLNEFDQFALHSLKPSVYVRYGDDFVLWYPTEAAAREAQIIGRQFLADELKLAINPKHDRVQPANKKLAYLGVDLWPGGRRLQARTVRRVNQKLTIDNIPSYQSLIKQHLPERYAKDFVWKIVDIIDQE